AFLSEIIGTSAGTARALSLGPMELPQPGSQWYVHPNTLLLELLLRRWRISRELPHHPLDQNGAAAGSSDGAAEAWATSVLIGPEVPHEASLGPEKPGVTVIRALDHGS
ncbi:unnamed protein product, partial [Durusdinium trenchii]